MQKLRTLPIVERLRHQIEATPTPKTEESILLRVLVQALVMVGIIATDVAAQTQISLWAVPLSIVGAVISWHRRKKRNVTLKFVLAIGMIATLLLFFDNLLDQKYLLDNRLLLAEFLIQLQVLHSFDLPRRQDLGYSMVIGLILLGVAGTLSQTLAFAPWLLLFLLLAIPTLILDYRSRLGLQKWEEQLKHRQRDKTKPKNWLKNSSLSPKNLGWFALIIIVLGLFLFAVMPRYAGYQLQTFPVKGSEELENRSFGPGGRGIVNPGYERDGSGRGGPLVEQETTEGKGQIDDTFYYGFNAKINQNLRGTMTQKKIVLRIRSQAPGFWRALAFDRYTGQGWEISRDDRIIDLNRAPWTYQFSVLLRSTKAGTKRIIQTFTVVSDLPNIIPTLSSPQYVYFPTKQIAIDTEESLRSPAGLIEGLTYTVISQVRYRNRTKLGQAPETYPSRISEHYLQIPPEIAGRVRKKTEELLAKSPKPLTSAYEKALYLAQAIKQNYYLQEELPFFEDEEDLVEAFLFRYEGGYPDHFATVYTMMLRSLGIPARLVVGLAPGQFNPFTGYYLVHNTDAYAMTEVYFPEYGWYYFDPLPGHEIIPPSFEEDRTFGVLGQFWRWVAGWLPSPVTSFISTLWTEVISRFFKLLKWLWQFVSGSLFGLFTGILGLIFLAFLAWLGWNGLTAWFYRSRLAKLAPIERLYRQMLDLMAQKGYPKHPAQTPLEYARYIYQHQEAVRGEIIEQICQSYVSWRYGQQIPNMDYLQGQFKALRRSYLSSQFVVAQ
jgi:transglutaminase-like putative cysteine protease